MEENAALALNIFDKFASASNLESILSHFRNILELLDLKPTCYPEFISALKSQFTTIEFQNLISKYKKRAQNKYYNNGRACNNRCRVLIIGAGPCGLRTAIEAQLMGAKVIVIEKRTEFSRNNVLHLWPFIITDLRNLGVKKFCPRFCAGSIDHISISQLQCVLLKIALLLGIEFHEGVELLELCEPKDGCGWRGIFIPSNNKLSKFDFDVMIGANGRQKVLPGFHHKELRAKLSIAITANFVNRRSAAEARIQEISGVSFIYRQEFFNNFREETGIDLENIVYYKDDTHYFVMTAKKHSLLWRGVFKENYADSQALLSHENIDMEQLISYTIDAVNYVTDGQLPNLEFALTDRNQPDISIFDFTTMYAAENACRIVEQDGYKLLLGLVGDSLLEPFWPTGSGCARGFLSSFDACWMIRRFAIGDVDPLEIIAERETIYRLLAQTTPECLNKDFNNYSIDPQSRYPNLVSGTVKQEQIQHLYTTDGIKSERNSMIHEIEVCKEKKDVLKVPIPKLANKSIKRINSCNNMKAEVSKTPKWNLDYLLQWFQSILDHYGIQVNGIHDIFIRGHALCGIIHHFRSDLIPEYPFPPEIEEGIEPADAAGFRNQIAYDLLHDEYNLPHVVSGHDSVQYAHENMEKLLNYLIQVYRLFKNSSLETDYEIGYERTDVESYEYDLEIQSTKSKKPLTRSKTMPTSHPTGPLGTERGRSGSIVKRMQNHFDSKQHLINSETWDTKNSLEKRDRARDAERCKLKAMEFISMIQLRNAEEQKEAEAERRQNIIKAIKAVHVADPVERTARNGNSTYQTSAINNDDFFNEYNMRLWRISVPSIEERRDKLENVFGSTVKKTTIIEPPTQQCIKEVLKAESSSQIGNHHQFGEGQGKRKVNLEFANKTMNGQHVVEENEDSSSKLEEEYTTSNSSSSQLSVDIEEEISGSEFGEIAGILMKSDESVHTDVKNVTNTNENDPSSQPGCFERKESKVQNEHSQKLSCTVKEKSPESASIDLDDIIEEDDMLSQLDDIELENLDAWAGKYL